MPSVAYASREQVMQALDVRSAAYSSNEVDRAILSASSNVEGLTHRIFYPLTATKKFPYPNMQGARAGRLWLDGNEVISLSSFTSGGVSIAATDYFLEPQAYGPPYDHLEMSYATNSVLNATPLTPQQALVLTGIWMGCELVESNLGTLSAAVSTTTATSIMVAGVNLGVGRVIRIDNERMIVTEKTFIPSGQTGTLTSNLNANSLTVADGTAFRPREEIIMDAERMIINEIIGNVLNVKRATSGSTLAAHTGSAINYGRQLTVSRGVLGTTAATHAISAPILRHVVPPLIEQLTIAYALERMLGESSGYARMVGASGSDTKGTNARGVEELETAVVRAYARKARMRAV